MVIEVNGDRSWREKLIRGRRRGEEIRARLNEFRRNRKIEYNRI